MKDDALLWFDHDGNHRWIRGKSGITRDRHGVVKFSKSMCERCNNARSKPFDQAYEVFSNFLHTYWVRITPGISFETIYGADWRKSTHDLARYYAKHFGCRMVQAGLPVPISLRHFLDGATDMSDAHMALITTDSVHRLSGKGLNMSPAFVQADEERTRFTKYVLASYVDSVGVRYQWEDAGIPDDERSQFFHFPVPALNPFIDETAVMLGETRRLGWFARLLQWAYTPSVGKGDSEPS